MKTPRAIVLVQGELAQSPRMLNHARCLLNAGWSVVLAGYAGVPLPADLLVHPQLGVHRLAPLTARRWRALPAFIYVPAAVAREALRALEVLLTLVRVGRADLYLVQNPPALPCLPLARAIAAMQRARLVVDWHNTSTSVLAFRLGQPHPLVTLLRALERRSARGASAHLCVSAALGRALAADWNIAAAVVYDRPFMQPARLPAAKRNDVVNETLRLLERAPGAGDAAVVVSPSSWSLEEDMPMFLEAMERYAKIPRARPLLVFATGIGPQRAAFEKRAAQLENARLRIVTGWLPEERYRQLLAAADAGVCMHRSTSRLDLPMKLADFEAAGLPAIAYDYGDVLRERPATAAAFRTADELALALHDALASEPAAAAAGPIPTWADEWREHAAAVLCR